jgi:lysophospholipase L1-like esterase
MTTVPSAPLPRVHAVGDSISMQYGPELERRLAGTAAYSRKSGRAGDLDRPQGANGGHSGMVLGYLRELERSAVDPFDLLLLNCGLHDVKRAAAGSPRQVESADYAANLRSILAIGRAIARRSAWIRTTPVVDAVHAAHTSAFVRTAADVDEYNAIADAVMRDAAVPIIDLAGFTRSLGGDELYCDHVHFVDSVRAQQATFVAAQAIALLADGAGGSPSARPARRADR